jgi:hypothetical protein
VLCAFYVVAKIYVRCFLFRPVHARPAFARHNEGLKLIDLTAVTALIATFFLLVAQRNELLRALLVVAALLAYDGVLRYWFLQVEIRRLRSSSRRWTYRDARRHVRRRAKAAMFH